MSYCNIQIPVNATIFPVDTRYTSQKVLFLPTASTVGSRVLTIKDYYGTARISSFTLSTTGLDTIDGFRNFFRFTSSFQALTLASDGQTNWKTLSYFNDANTLQTPFSPSTFSSLALWVDGSDPWNQGPFSTVVSTAVPIWYDKSGGQRNLVWSTVSGGAVGSNLMSTAYVSTFGTYCNWTIRFRDNRTCFAGDQRYFSAGNTGTTAVTVFQGSGQYNFRHGDANQARTIFSDTAGGLDIAYGVSNGVYNTFNATNSQFGTLSVVWNPSTQRSYYRANGAPVGTAGFIFNLSTNNESQRFLLAGENLGSGQAFRSFTGHYAEFLYYNDSLPSSQVQILEGYLAWKWGIQERLNSNHPYRFITPSSYDFSSPT
jgi:hypothetical protein